MPNLLTAEPAPRIVPRLNPPIDTRTLITDTEDPVESMFIEKQLRLLTELRSNSWTPPDGKHFEAVSDVGLFFEDDVKHPLVPDAMLTLDYPTADIRLPDHRSFFTWIVGKVPDVVIEVVSPEPAGEDSYKMRKYEARRIPNYVVFDPDNRLKGGPLRAFRLVRGKYRANAAAAFPDLALSLVLWDGKHAGMEGRWLRWADLSGTPIPTANERAEGAEANAKAAEAKAKVAEANARELAAKLRALGVEP